MDKTTLLSLTLILPQPGSYGWPCGWPPITRVVDVLNTFCLEKVEPFIQASYKKVSDYRVLWENWWWNVSVLWRGIWTAKNVTSSTSGTMRVFVMLTQTEDDGHWGCEVLHTCCCRQYIGVSEHHHMSTETELIDYIEAEGRTCNLPVEQVAFTFVTTWVSSGTGPPSMVSPHPSRPWCLLFNHFLKERRWKTNTTPLKMEKRLSSLI